MKVGFTGTRQGMTDQQHAEVADILSTLRSDIFESEFHHGNCVGADEQALEIATNLNYYTIAHPASGLDDLQISVFASDEARNYRQPLARNRDIVREADVMIATPKEMEQPRSARGSGTWFTIEHCRKQNIKRRLIIVWPNGSVTKESNDN